MQDSPEPSKIPNTIESELYFLIAKFLEAGPCKGAAEELKREIEEHELLPKRLDWTGKEHHRTFEDLVNSNQHIHHSHLLQICQRIGPLLDKEIKPGVPMVRSLLGAGRQSILRTKDDLTKQHVSHTALAARHRGAAVTLPVNLSRIPNTVQILTAREISGPFTKQQLVPTKIYRNFQQFCRRLGHLSSVYCVLFDRTGRYIFTGADDLLVKIWSAHDGRLCMTLRGHSAEITDIAVNYENTLLAAGSCNKIIRVWCLKTSAPIAVLVGHTGMITSLQFCPYPKGEDRYLVSTGNDGCIYFWQWNLKTSQFNPLPRKFTERNRPGAQMLCSTFSPGGTFVATGSTDHHVRVYNVFGQNGPEKIFESEAHTDRVDSIQFANRSERFVSGSKDGTANIWRLENKKWKNILLKMSIKLPGEPLQDMDDTKVPKFKVTMVGWDLDDRYVITAVNDFSIKVWDSTVGNLIYRLEAHEDEAFVIEAHPTDPRIFLSAGHDGRIIIWDLSSGVPVKKFFNVIEGQGHGAVFDCKFSPGGNLFASTDSHGHISIFGCGTNEKFKKIPDELFFHTDYRPLIRDNNHHVLDEQTQQAPHLMQPPFLVNIDGNPYPPEIQRCVYGRENCNESQLIPHVIVNAGAVGNFDVIEAVRPNENDTDSRPNIDFMIQRLQNEQAVRRAVPENNGPLSPRPVALQPNQIVSPSHNRVGMRRSGDVEGVRQSQGNWQSGTTSSQNELVGWGRRIGIPVDECILRYSEMLRLALADQELQHFRYERRRRSENVETSVAALKSSFRRIQVQKRSSKNVSRNSRIRRRIVEEEGESHSSSSSSSEPEERLWDSSSDNDSDSSEYSDWTQDAGINLKPPKRTQMKSRSRSRRLEDDDDYHEQERPASTSKKKKRPSRRELHRKARRRTVENGSRESPPQQNGPSTSTTTQERVPKEIPLAFRPPEWLTETVPHKAPYYPQMGDEIIYFLQGHKCYVEAIKRTRVYNIGDKNQPWAKINLRDQELVKVVGIKYEIRPPRLCCLKLALIDPETSKMTGQSFTIKYHDMPDVIDFLVLRQTYDTAMSHNWKQGDRFRSMIDGAWWVGVIESHEPYQPDYQDSMFQCFNVAWDNGEKEKMSPWDLEPLSEERMPSEVGGSIEVLPEELKALLYKPREGEWPEHGMDEECERIIHGLEQIMELAIAEPFAAPVDLSRYPTYARIVEYPVDLSIIKARLENRFYRRVTSVQFDVRHVESNAKKFNEPRSHIVKQARIVTDLCLKLVEDSTCTDIKPLYQDITEHYESDGDEDVDIESDSDSGHDGTSDEDVVRKSRKSKGSRADSEVYDSNSWKEQCIGFLNIIFECEDSEPFRRPVDPLEEPRYREIIDTPNDFGTIRERLNADYYKSPVEFCKDARIIFQNSRNYNTNKKSRIYSMTIRLSAMFEEKIREIISDWKSAVNYEEKIKNNCYVSNRRRPLPQLRAKLPQMSSRTSTRNSNQPSTSNYSSHIRNRKQKNKVVNRRNKSSSRKVKSSSGISKTKAKKKISSDDEDDNDYERNKENRSQNTRRSRRLTISRQKANAGGKIINGHTKRSPAAKVKSKKSVSDSDKTESDEEESKSSSDSESVKYTPKIKKGHQAGTASENSSSSDNRKKSNNSSSASSGNSDNSKSSSKSSRSGSGSSDGSQSRSSSGSESGTGSNARSRSSDSSNSDSQLKNGNTRRKKHKRRSSNDETQNNSDENSSNNGNSSESQSDSDDNDDDDQSIVRRSKRTYTRNSTKATRSALSARQSNSGSTGERANSRMQMSSPHPEVRETRASKRHHSDSDELSVGKSKSGRRSKRIATRNRGKRTVRYREDSDFEYEFNSDDNSDSDDAPRVREPSVSISSRGRVRKLTPLVKGFIRR